jgi:hypothetical protein
LTDLTFNVKLESRHSGEAINIVGADCASAESYISRGEVKRLRQNADVLEDQ